MGSNPVTYIVSPGDDVSGAFIYASNEPKSVLARDLGDCRDNLRNSQSVFLIVLHFRKVLEILPSPYIYVVLMSC